MKKTLGILLLLLSCSLFAQKKPINDFTISIHEESINKIIDAIGPVTGSNQYDAFLTNINYTWTLENSHIQIRPDSSQFICDVQVQAGIIHYKTQVHGDVKISYDTQLNQIQIKVVRAIFELYTKVFGKKVHIKNIDLAENFSQPFIFEGPRSLNTNFDFTLPDGTLKKVYVQANTCTIELRWKEILVLFEIDACDVPFNTFKTGN